MACKLLWIYSYIYRHFFCSKNNFLVLKTYVCIYMYTFISSHIPQSNNILYSTSEKIIVFEAPWCKSHKFLVLENCYFKHLLPYNNKKSSSKYFPFWENCKNQTSSLYLVIFAMFILFFQYVLNDFIRNVMSGEILVRSMFVKF